MDSDSLSTAFHEAGHVLIHEIFEWPYTDVSIAKVGNEAVNYSYPDPQNDSPLIEKLIYACICCAGAVAEDKFNNKKNLGYSILSGYPHPSSDATKFTKLVLPKGYGILIFLDFVANIVIENWEFTSKIAQTIYDRKHVNSEDIKHLLNDMDFVSNKERYLQQLMDMKESP